jgi:hypothetical protein
MLSVSSNKAQVRFWVWKEVITQRRKGGKEEIKIFFAVFAPLREKLAMTL